jgi:16S rRNA processing protein RimM
MQVEDCYLVGQVLKPHGIHGEVKVYFDVDDIEAYEDKESIYIRTGSKLTPFLIRTFRIISPNQAVVKFQNVDTRNDAELLSGMETYLPLSELPPLKEGQFYYHDIIGYQIVDLQLGPLGKISKVLEMPGNDLIEMAFKGKQVLIPINDAIVKKADSSTQTVTTELPEGLLDIYLGLPEKEDQES